MLSALKWKNLKENKEERRETQPRDLGTGDWGVEECARSIEYERARVAQ